MKDLQGSKPSTVRQHILTCMRAKPKPIPTFIWGAPGVGKSAVVAQIAKDEELELRDLRLLLLNPTDLAGIPFADIEKRVAEWLVPKFMPRGGKGILFLDELNAAPQAVQAAAYQLVYDNRCGDYVLPEGWFIVAAGNRAEDRAITFEMPSPLRRRMLHLEMKPDVEDFIAWAMATNQAPQVVAFIRWKGSEILFQFDPKIHTRSFPCPATWEYVSRLMNGGLKIDGSSTTLIGGTVGEAAAIEFVAFVEVFGSLPNAEEILWEGKMNVKVPTEREADRLYAFTSALASAAARAPKDKKKDAAKRLFTFVTTSMPPEFAVKTVKDFSQTDSFKTMKRELAATAECKQFVDRFGALITEA